MNNTTKNNSYCCVPKCYSWRKRSPEITFHKFPPKGQCFVDIRTKSGCFNKVDRQKAWILQLSIGKAISKSMKVCSLHFLEEDFLKTRENIKKRHLKKIAVPSQKLPLQRLPDESVASTSAIRLSKRNKKKLDELKNSNVLLVCEQHKEVADSPLEHTTAEVEVANVLINQLYCSTNEGPKSFRDFQVQVNTPKKLTVCDLIVTDESLSSFTGLNNFIMLNFIVGNVSLAHSDVRVHKLNIKERVILTFTKMKCNLSYVILAVFFGITPTLCRMYVIEMLNILANVLKPAIKFPNMEEIKKNMPLCFENFKDTQLVLDCTEIYIQKPKCLCCRLRFYSHYKSSQTVKFLVGVSPAGLITFLSSGFGGRASDKAIFEQSDILNRLDKDVAVMVDKGFLIDQSCEQYGIKLYRPPFLKNKKQLTKDEAIYNSKIAAARVHIERCDQRIKVFKILGGKLQWSLVNHVEEIFTIACAITNLSAPILYDDKFFH